MKERSTQAVVGLCGNDSTMTRGLGHDSSHACMRPSKNASPGIGRRRRTRRRALQRDLAHVGAGEERAPDVDRVRGRGHQRGVPRADQHPHQVGEALLGPDGGDHLRSRGRARRRTCAGRGRRWRCAASGCRVRRSSGGCAGSGRPRPACSTATSGEGRSGFPKPRSMTSRPARRAAAFRSLMVAKT